MRLSISIEDYVLSIPSSTIVGFQYTRATKLQSCVHMKQLHHSLYIILVWAKVKWKMPLEIYYMNA